MRRLLRRMSPVPRTPCHVGLAHYFNFFDAFPRVRCLLGEIATKLIPLFVQDRKKLLHNRWRDKIFGLILFFFYFFSFFSALVFLIHAFVCIFRCFPLTFLAFLKKTVHNFKKCMPFKKLFIISIFGS
jgi:hypothetical protein